jgi:hypothetical protein
MFDFFCNDVTLMGLTILIVHLLICKFGNIIVNSWISHFVTGSVRYTLKKLLLLD